MKIYFYLATLLLIVAACSSGSTSENRSDTTTTSSTAQAVDPKNPIDPGDTLQTFVNWPEVGVREVPGDKGKYLATVYLAENVDLVGDTASQLSGKKRVHYTKIKLLDGKECWIRTDFLAIGYKPAVMFHNTGIFSRPDRIAATGKRFDDYEIVAVRWAKHGWLEVRGVASGEKWYTNGYISTDDVFTSADDVKFAALKKRADAATDPKLKEALESQFAQFSGTSMYASIFGSDSTDQGEAFTSFTVSEAYLEGEWTREWSDASNNSLSETIWITADLEYITDKGTLEWPMSDVAIDSEEFTIMFEATVRNVWTKTSLRAVSYERMMGTEIDKEGKSTEVTYTRAGG